jgi:hypothetical protein
MRNTFRVSLYEWDFIPKKNSKVINWVGILPRRVR